MPRWSIRSLFHLVLLWLAGVDLRLTVLAVPPLLTFIHRDLGLDEKTVAALSGLPVLIFGMVAIPASLLIARIGPRRALILGLSIGAAGAALRGVGPSTAMLFAMTGVMAFGIALMQPALPALVGRWFAGRTGFATAVYANGMLIGEGLAAALTLSLVLPLLGGSWSASLAFWSLPLAVTAALVWAFTAEAPAAPVGARRPLWLPDWRDAQAWQLGIVFAGSGAIYFGTNALIPDYLVAIGRGDLIGPSLSTLNFGQVPASFLLLLLARRFAGRKGPLIAMSLLVLAALALFLVPATWTMLVASAVFGFCAAFILILSLALPPLLAGPEDVHRLSAGMFTIGYALLFLIPLLGGAAWDWSGIPASAFLPVALGALSVLVMALRLRLARR